MTCSSNLSIQERYEELLALTQLYLLQEYSTTDRIPVDREDFIYFRNQAIAKKASQQPPVPAAIPLITNPSSQSPRPAAATPRSPPPEQPSVPPQPVITPSQPPTAAVSVETQKKPPVEQPARFIPEPLTTPSPQDLNEMKKLLTEKTPHFKLLDAIPSDSPARQQAATSSFQVAILLFSETGKVQQLLMNLANTLEIYGISTKVIQASRVEQQKAWEALLQVKSLKLIVGCSHNIEAFPILSKHYQEATKQGKHHFLGDIPFLPLPDPAFYLKEPSLKPSLWKAIKDLLRL